MCVGMRGRLDTGRRGGEVGRLRLWLFQPFPAIRYTHNRCSNSRRRGGGKGNVKGDRRGGELAGRRRGGGDPERSGLGAGRRCMARGPISRSRRPRPAWYAHRWRALRAGADKACRLPVNCTSTFQDKATPTPTHSLVVSLSAPSSSGSRFSLLASALRRFAETRNAVILASSCDSTSLSRSRRGSRPSLCSGTPRLETLDFLATPARLETLDFLAWYGPRWLALRVATAGMDGSGRRRGKGGHGKGPAGCFQSGSLNETATRRIA
jgi:hypothetical protein